VSPNQTALCLVRLPLGSAKKAAQQPAAIENIWHGVFIQIFNKPHLNLKIVLVSLKILLE